MTDASVQPGAALSRDAATGRPVLRLDQRYPHPPGRIWRALTDGAELSRWTPWEVAIDPVPGGAVLLAFAGGAAETGTVTAAEPPRLLEFHWRGIPGSPYDENLRWTVAPVFGSSDLALTVTLQDLAHAPQSAAGYHLSLIHLGDLLAGRPVRRAEIPPADPRFQPLVDHYTGTLPGEV
ncbi:SRPBCC domain-containing protein [Actinomadura opuntiae]|uniref:SRPBCC domain-containing protein n=1 Tax=Actinomadura sp. OS1-43 TaxID=604315 RepID=UPI00255B363F|nr:SRPBCC domain-containing protein [Actinomadura sp. OS1-43]MDL4820257.1 SRPBCC domain-containing protein [Actinomadura sp. OS1-43]